MNDKWINDLEKKMKDHTEIGPEGLWEDLEQKLFGEEKGKVIPLWSDTVQQVNRNKKASRKRTLKRILGVAASLIAITIGAVEYFSNRQQVILENIGIGIKENAVGKSIHNPIKEVVNTESISRSHIQGNSSIVNRNSVQGSSIINRNNVQGSSIIKEEPNKETYIPNQIQDVVVVSDGSIIDKEKVNEIITTIGSDNENKQRKTLVNLENKEDVVVNKEKKKSKGGFSLGFLSSNMSGNSSQFQSGYASMKTSKVDVENINSSSGNPSLSQIYTANLDKDVNTKIDHKKPIRFGIAVSYQMGEKWAINSGITYTKLSSELNSGSEAYKIISDQTLHYVGIPIQVNYNLWQKGQFSAYANGGVLVEKAVSGTLKTKYKMGEVIEQGPNEKIHIKGIQSSVNMSLGMEYKLGKEIGIFVEPGVRYYFDDGSSVSNAYKEKPFSFNAQIGLRYAIPNGRNNKNKEDDLSIVE